MKKNISLLFALYLGFNLTYAQVETADLSPRSTVQQQVGLTNLELDYSRPSARNRKVFGEIVAYDKMWRTGANLNTTISFDTEVYVGKDTIKAGKYSLFTIPDEKEWTLYLYSKTDIRGVPREWDKDLVVLELKSKVKKLNDFVETFTIAFNNIGSDEFKLVLSWENTAIEIPFRLPTTKLTKESIKKVMNGPSDRDYYLAASFYLDQNEQLETALEYINKAVEMRGEDAFWYTRKQAQILYANGKIKEAIKAAELSKEVAERVNYTSYVKMNEEDIAKWKKEL
jgi:tetratricopeptide (TPR) repeat protein